MADQGLRRYSWIEPVRPGVPFEDDDLPVVVRRDIRARLHRQHGERLPDVIRLAPDAGDAKNWFVLLCEQPLVLALFPFFRWIGELVEAVRNDQAAIGVEVASVGAKIVHRPFVLRPAPAALHQFRLVSRAVDRSYDRTYVGDLDVLSRLQVRGTFAEADLDLQVREILDDRGHVHHQPIIIAHVFLAVLVVKFSSCYVLHMTSAKVFQSDAPLDERRVIIRRHEGDVEMVELPWGLRSLDGGPRAVNVVRSEGRTFPTNRCLVPASEFRHRSGGKHFRFSLANGDWFYFAGIWRQASNDWPEAYAILTIDANADIAPYHDRQMAVLTRDQRMDWLDGLVPEDEILRPLPAGTFRVRPLSNLSFRPRLAV